MIRSVKPPCAKISQAGELESVPAKRKSAVTLALFHRSGALAAESGRSDSVGLKDAPPVAEKVGYFKGDN